MEQITSYAQAAQDLFVFALTEGKTDGYYVDIGCNHESFHSNTYALEQLGWRGLLIDTQGGCENRKGQFIKCDARTPDEHLRTAYGLMPCVVDYLSLDADDATIDAMNALPWTGVTFRVITVEHDKYRVGHASQLAILDILRSLNYRRVCTDVIIPDYGEAEDWYVHPDLVNPELVTKYTCTGKSGPDIMK